MRILLISLLVLCVEGAPQGECDSVPSNGQCPNDIMTQAVEANATKHEHNGTVIEQDEDAEYFDLGVPQRLDRVDLDDFQGVMVDALRHLMEIGDDPELEDAFFACKNRDPHCVEWAIGGRCDSINAKEMKMMVFTCCPVCEAAEELDFLTHCPMDPNAYTAYAKPGDVNRHFMKSLEMIDPKYEPKLLSSPDFLPGDNDATADYKVGGPWIVTMENFVNKKEAERLIYWGKTLGYERSTDNGGLIVDHRTSSEIFCERECYTDPIIQGIMKRIVDIVGIPEEHSDYFQLLQYNEGDFYKVHQDYHQHQVFSATGARILTFYIYLNTVEEGGGTNFPALNITVSPKLGRVAMWSNVLDSDPEEEDLKARHQALPVGKGEKYGATAWFHHRDYKNNMYLNGRDCTR